MIFDTDNGTQDDYTSNPLNSGTYTLTIPDNVKDSNGNSLRQSVSKTFSL